MEFIKSQFSSEIEYQNSIQETIAVNFGIFEELESQFEKPFNRKATVEFSFVSNSMEKLKNLSSDLNSKYLCIESEEGCVEENLFLKSWVIHEKEVEIQKINEWVFELLILGQQNDCLFNGWGIYPV